MRVPWGEGNGDGGVSARGSCQGGGCTAPRPCPGFPLSRERRWGRWREGFVSGWGMHRPAPLPWIPAFAGTTMGALARGVRVRVGDAPPRAPALDSRFRGNDDGGVGARGSCQGGGCTAPRPCPGFPLSRERRWGSWREGFVSGWGMHRPAPLPWIPAFAGTTMGALARGVRSGWGMHRPAPLPWIPAFAGTTMGDAEGFVSGWGRTGPCPGFPLSRERRWGRLRRGSGWGMQAAPEDGPGNDRGAPFDRLRANGCGFGKGACRGVAGSREGPLRTGPSRASGRAQGERIWGARGMRWDLSGLLGCGIIARAASWVFGARLCMRAREEGAPPQANSRRHLPFFPIGMAGHGAQRCCRPRARRDDERCQIPHPHGTAYPLPRPRGMRRTGSGRRVGSQLLTRRSPRPAQLRLSRHRGPTATSPPA